MTNKLCKKKKEIAKKAPALGAPGQWKGAPVTRTGKGLFSGDPLGLGQHGAGLLAGDGVDQVVAEENLRRCSTRSAVLGGVVSADVHCAARRRGNPLDLNSLAVGAGNTIGLTLGGLDDKVEVGHNLGQALEREGEGGTLADDGGCTGVLDADQLGRVDHCRTAASDDPVVQPGEQVGSGDLGLGAEDTAAFLRKGQLIPGEDLGAGQALPHSGELLENALDLGLVSGADRATITAVADVLAALHLSGRNALGAAAHLLEGDGRNVLHIFYYLTNYNQLPPNPNRVTYKALSLKNRPGAYDSKKH